MLEGDVTFQHSPPPPGAKPAKANHAALRRLGDGCCQSARHPNPPLRPGHSRPGRRFVRPAARPGVQV